MRKIPLLLPLFLASPALAEIDFVHQVIPILEQHCTECHGGEEAKGGFSLNTRELFLDDDSATPGDAVESYFIQLITDPDPYYQMPPEESERVPAEHLAILKAWVDEGMKWEPGFTFGIPTYEPPFAPRRPELPSVTEKRDNPIDRIIDHHLATNRLPVPEPIDDATFFRRIHLDLVGLLPEPDAVTAFLEEERKDKRSAIIDELLASEIAYTEHWLTFWNDLLRNDYAGTGFITGGRSQISGWLYDSLKENKPFDAMVREIIAPADKESEGFINGIKWRGEVSAGQTLPIQFSQSVSQSFLGINMKCASCHDSFIDQWKLSDAYGLAAIYAEEELELHRCDKPTGEIAKAAWLFPEIGDIDPDKPKAERLDQLAALMTHPENGRVPRTIVNRIWGQLMGRGIVHPLDAMQSEPWSEDLLDWIAADFQEHSYDLKHTIRLVTNSAAYQSQTSEPQDGEYTYAGPQTKRLTAEQFSDAIWQITGSHPAAYDAPVVRGVVTPELIADLAIPSSWIWSERAKAGPLPTDAEVLLRRKFKPKKEVQSAGIIAAADNMFTLYLNNREILTGDRWTDLSSAPITNLISAKGNQILLVAKNAGPKPNPSGAFCAIRIEYTDGTDEIIVTDASWDASDVVPAGNKPGKWKLDELTWQPAHLLSSATWKKATDPRIGETLAKASAGSAFPVRASLVKSDFLMTTLGRPNRDQIVTSRPNELTTLEALELANNSELSSALLEGAGQFAGENSIDNLYLATLSRYPSDKEKTILKEVFGDKPAPSDLADALWALTMTPEFFLIR